MKDQAAGLRRLMERKAKGIDLEFQNIVHTLFPEEKSMVFLGTDRDLLSLSVVTANCAVELRRSGKRIALLEDYEEKVRASLLLGCEAPLTLNSLSRAKAFLPDIIYRSAQGINLIRGLSALKKAESWDGEAKKSFFFRMRCFLDQENDFVFINELNPGFSLLLKKVVLVFSPDRESVINAYAKLKKIIAAEVNPSVSCIVVNATPEQAAKAAAQFSATSKDFLKTEISFAGSFSFNEEVVDSIKKQEPFVDMYRYSARARLIREMAVKLVEKKTEGALQE